MDHERGYWGETSNPEARERTTITESMVRQFLQFLVLLPATLEDTVLGLV